MIEKRNAKAGVQHAVHGSHPAVREHCANKQPHSRSTTSSLAMEATLSLTILTGRS